MPIRALSLAALAAACLAGPAHAQAPARATQIGTLACDVSGGVGMIVTSKKAMVCTFTDVRGRRETYAGTIRKFGLDIGATTGGKMLWTVFAPGRAVRGALAGEYAGGSAEATVVGGLGANVLLGGSNRSIALQPVSVGGQTGFNLAVGIADLQLRSVRA